MSSPIVERFVEICRAVTADGRVNCDELAYLAKWLKDHPKASKCWPGSLFVEPLNSYFADGSIDDEEIEAATRLLRQVEREFAERNAPSPTVEARPAKNEEATSSEIKQGLALPVVNWTGRAIAGSQHGFYKVELATPSCTCMDFSCRRKALPNSHPARACKHIVKCLWEEFQNGRVVLSAEVAALIECSYYIQSGISLKPGFVSFLLRGKAVVVSQGHLGWFDIVTHTGDGYQRFGYSKGEGRWSYGIAPPNWEEIAAQLRKLRLKVINNSTGSS